MALKKNSGTAPAAGQFEDDNTAGPGTTTADAPEAPSEAAQASAGVAATTAIAKAATTSVALPGKFAPAFKRFENVIADVEFGTIPRIIGSNGQVMDKDNNKLGEEIELELVSTNQNYTVSPGSDKDEAKALVRYSRDGITIDATGELVSSYIQKLKDDDWDDANVKEYTELIGIVTKAKGDKHVGSMVQVSLSPMSAKTFRAHDLQTSVKVSRGLVDPAVVPFIKLTADVKSFNGKNYTQLTVSQGAVPA